MAAFVDSGVVFHPLGTVLAVLFAALMAALILWMGIGSGSFTRRTEASARNVFVLMQRPQAYNARAALQPARPISGGRR